MTTSLVRIVLSAICLLGIVDRSSAADKPPRAIDDRLKIELFAEHPDIVTPTGIDVDHQGRVWAIESNTHFPPAGYKGHNSDRILVMQDSTGDHKADKITMFADGLKHTMSIAVKPVWLEGRESRVDIFIATRRAIWLYTDTNGDLKADKKQRIIQLDTKGDYPHNGLAGFAFDAMGWMYFGFGENLGADYKIIGSDGVTLKGGGEGGNVYRCRPDGSKLTQWATGFWNPHASCVDAFGRLFTVDNDPDSRPPCRLLHVIEGGDYGFRFRNGRKGLHPFTAWNGEIPGTLPMVSGTGEAPSGIVAYESDGFPKDYIGNLLVGSWGDHRIDRFRLKPRGASFEAIPETIIQGGEEFRPVGLAVAPDGSLFLTDWVKRDYKLHGHGRVWRVSVKQTGERRGVSPPSKQRVIDLSTITPKRAVKELTALLSHPRLEVRREAARRLAQSPAGRRKLLMRVADRNSSIRSRIESYWANVVRAFRQPPPQDMLTAPKEVLGDLPSEGSPDAVITAYCWLAAEYDLFRQFDKPGIIPRRAMASIRSFDVSNKSLDPPLTLALIASASLSEKITNHPFQCKNFEVHIQDPFYHFANVLSLSGATHIESFRNWWTANPKSSPLAKTIIVLAARKSNRTNRELIQLFLKSPAPLVRLIAVQWVAEENLKDLRPQVEAILNSETMTTDLFLATLAALEMLDGKDPKDFDKTPAGKYVLPLVKDDERSPAVRAQALRLVDENDSALTKELMAGLMSSKAYSLRLETVRTLQFAKSPDAKELLIKMAQSERPWRQPRDEADYEKIERTFFDHRRLMLEAILGLAVRANQNPPDKDAMKALTSLLDESLEIRIEVIRSLRTVAKTDKKVRGAILASINFRTGNPDWWDDVDEHLHMIVPEDSELAAGIDDAWKKRPDTTENWIALAQKKAVSYDKTKQTMGIETAASGRRVFFHPNSAGCYKCHTVNGRGGKIGPDLSRIGRALNRKQLAESILEPSKEIAPQYTNWTFIMESGKVHTGIILGDTRDKKQTIGLADGTTLELPTAEIEERQPQTKSVMPEKLIERLTVGEFRDLLAYLETLK